MGTPASALGSAGRIEEAKAVLAKAAEVEPRFPTKGFIKGRSGVQRAL
jgi:hypothetical protein